ncbi:dienelactone hydrolase [Paenibacillus polymyxa]|nr:dienelactone hydrolase [Paenibacillus polymyxa]MBE7899223.1 dienelactone hydrolase [Paenibacillus polymyxa]MBG9766996.1 dienelactone hydrolase [Paenibacillus polymyxa]MCC3258409.1 dienelactone hydrolase [Paenibacillus polymyxa]QPK53963.1 dienelactone hydrolase [Paenibacillus polymyxa]QPK59050.1 dienelactone hydrolase [Paenibacillus polymyxa]
MRIFEMLLFFSSACLLALLFLTNQRIRRSALLLTSGASSIFLVIHLLVEGYRVQLLFLYGFTILMLMLSLINVFITPKVVRTASRIRRVLGRLFIVIGLIATGCFLYVFPVFNFPAPTGELKVGTQIFHFIDPSREETFGKTETGKRELMVQVWYPTQASTSKYAPFIPDTEILRYMAANYGLPGFTFQHLKYVSSHAYSGAEVSSAQTSYPLILANPGNGSSRFLHTSQAENLASHGYIVAVIDHTYNTFATEFPDGRITTSTTDDLFSPDHDYRTESENRDKLGKVLTGDVAFTLDQFELIQSGQIPSQLKGKIDLGHVGVFGHSIGGATAYDASYDPRIAVGIDFDGGLYRLRDREGLRKPFLFINTESYFEKLKMVMDNRVYTDAELKRMGSTREWEDQVTEDKKLELERMRETVDEGGQVLYIENTEHLNFTDVQFISPIFKMLGITGQIAPERANSVINAYMLDFFDMYLKNQGGILMKGPDSRFPEVKFVTSLL